MLGSRTQSLLGGGDQLSGSQLPGVRVMNGAPQHKAGVGKGLFLPVGELQSHITHQADAAVKQLGVQGGGRSRLGQGIFALGEQDAYGKAPGGQLPQQFCTVQKLFLPEEKGSRHAVAFQGVQQPGKGLGGGDAVFIGGQHFGQAGEQQGGGSLGQRGRRRGVLDAAGPVTGPGNRLQPGGVAGQDHAVGQGRLVAGQTDDRIAHTGVFGADKGKVHAHPGCDDGHRQIGYAVAHLGRNADGALEVVIGEAGVQFKVHQRAHTVDGDQLFFGVVVGVNALHFLQGGVGGVDNAVDVDGHLVIPHQVQHLVLGDGNQVAVGRIGWYRGGKQRQKQGQAQQNGQKTAHAFPSLQ